MQTPPTPSGNGAHRAPEDRREALKRIIRDGVVGRQAELVRLLKRAGHPVTQSSVSRDLRDLGVAKVGDRYVLPEDAAAPVAGLQAVAAFVQDVVPAGPHLTVVRTTIGSAQSVALAIDRARWPEVVGTLSGDDTIFIATASERAQRAVRDRLRSLASR
ncbi:MAG: arginine repressor [Proteobacteria bacterium]|nr:arginine repressor [Pseudomonadota bacterium]